MKNNYLNTVLKTIKFLLIMILIFGNVSITNAQNVTFAKRGISRTINGDFQMIGNTNLTLVSYTDSDNNSNNDMKVVDTDGDNSTTNSSSATLNFSTENGANINQTTILFAGLYWSGRTSDNVTDARKKQIKIKGPSGSYSNYTASEIRFPGTQNMYVGFVDVTSLVQSQRNGSYTVADMAVSTGNGGSIGYYGGWGMIVVYDNPQMNLRDISIFDGYAFIDGPDNTNFTLDVTGINTVKSGTVNMKMGLMAGEGDVGISGDYFEIKDQSNNWVRLSHADNSTTNFFNSSVYPRGTRNPDLKNNTGVDVSMFTIPNANNSVIKNEQTSASFRYGSTQDTYVIYCLTTSSDAYLPGIKLTKTCTPGCYSTAGSILSYRFEVKNDGNAPLNTVVVTDTKTSTPVYSSGDSNTNNILDINETWIFTANYTVTANDLNSSSIVNTAEVTAKDPQNKSVKASGSNTVFKAPTVAITSQTNVSCNGGANGTIDITASGGTGTYTYDWADLPGTNDLEDRTGLVAGTYKVTVKNPNGCASTELSVTITQPAAITVTNTKTDVLCFGASTGAINITASGGTGAYTYDWADLAGTNDIEDRTGLAAGTYTVTVKDANGCSTTALSVIISQPDSAVAVAKTSQTDVLCFGASTGAINITASGGTGAYTYDWADLVGTNDIENRTGLAAGTYTVTVKDANGCSTTALSVIITQPDSAVAVAKTSQTDVLCFGASTGAINITASGGTGAYTYDWADLAGTNDIEDRTGLAAGTYNVTVKDANGCSTTALSIIITQPASAVAVAKTSQTDVSCFGATTGAINITASGGTGAYTYDWADLAGTNDIEDRTGLAAGTYTVTVKDANDCSTAALSVIITQPASAVAVAKTSQTDVSCFGASTGAINITASGGTGAYTYDWADLAGTNDIEDRTGLAAGTYTVTVKDANGCSTAALSVIITQPASAVAVAKTSQTDVLCFGASTGAINITASGGTGAYTYDWADLVGTNDVEDRTGLVAGTYTVTVKDANGCSTAALSIIITQPTSAVAVAKTSQTDVLCFGASTGAINITASGGTGAYTYDWADLVGTNDIEDRTGLAAGTYTVTVKDANGCSTAALSVTIGQPEAVLTCSIIQNKAVSANGLSDGQATVTPLGGNGGYTYLWDNDETTAKAVALNAGLHTVTVTDSKGCKTTCEITITQPDVLSCSITQDAPAKCYGDSNGKATVSAIGGNGDYTYLWDNGETTAQAVGLNAGSHTVTVTDKLGYKTTCNITIGQPEAVLTCSIIQNKAVSANGLSDGQATVTPLGGNGGYTYLWDNDETTAKAVALNAGLHTVTVTDSKGCKTTCEITITQPDVLSCSITQDAPAKCYGDSNGKATVTAIGGNGDYTYLWDNGETTAQAVGLNAGSHTVTVTDKLGYKTTCNITIGQPEAVLTCSIIQNKAVSANGLSDGQATVTPLGGNGGYTYLWDNDETTAKAVALNAGLHTVTVTDSKGCKTTCEITITQPDVLSCSITQDAPAKCYGDSNGKATVTAIGGNGDYTYLWDNGETTAQAVGLNAGSHTVTVTDKLGYKTTCNITIGQPEAVLTCSIIQNKAVSANGLSDGQATVTPLGGNGGYTYLWDNDETTAKAVALNAGLHTVTVTDSKGCKTTCEITITQPDVLSCSITQDAPAKCYGDSNGKATVTAIGGNGDYTYLWDNGETTAQAVGLNAGSHTVTVTDKLGYKTTCNVTIGQPEAVLTCSIIQNKAVSANGLSDGQATVTPLGGNGGYTYLWDNDETTAKAVALNAGLHTVTVTDSKGCKTTCEITITQPDVLSCSITQDAPAKCYGDSNGKATVTAIGGNGDYTYLWDNGETTAQAVGLNAGSHTVTVTDKLGYKTTCNVTIGQPEAVLTCSIIQNKAVSANGLSDGQATVTPLGGNGGYTYLWDNDETTAKAVALNAGLHTVTVTDSKGCKTTCEITITQPDVLSCSITQDAPAKCYGDSNGKATVTAIGGNGNYTYLWDNGETTAQAVGLNAGSHTVTVTDKLGYKTTCNVTIGQPEAVLTCSIIQNKAVSANGLSDGQATVTPLGGNGGYTYLWDNDETTAKAVALNAGLHTVTITDSKGCKTTCEITITQPDVLSCSITQDAPAKCYGDSNGKATVTAIGGNGDYTYSWDNGETTAQAVGLNAGSHTVTVTDKLGYKTTCNVTIGQPEAVLTCSIIQNKAVSANGLSDGEATVTPLGGNGGYTYLWDNAETTAKAVALNAGLHTVTVTDSKGCKTTCEITISQPDVLSCSITQDAPAKCYGDSNGKATVTAIGGNGDYTYLWDNGETTAQAVGLNAGSHTVTVTDKLGYKTTCNVTIGQPEAVLTCSIIQNKAVSANGLNDGQATVTPLGGNGGYTYLWDNDETTAKAVALNAGLHTVTVTDSKGCKTTCEITITQPDVLSCSITQDAPAKCYGDSNGKATVSAIGGNGDYTYLWDNGETTAQAVGLNAGSHTVTVTDKLGYKTTCNVTIGQPEAVLTCSIIQNKAVSANGLSDGQATVTPLGGNGGYTYLWDNDETTAKAVALNAGLHTVTVTDSKGCKTTCEITITQPDVLSCSITQDAPAKCYGDSNGKATVTAIGGNGDYTYLWDNGETTAQAVGLNAGSHTVTVTDKLGYKTTCNVTIGQPEAVLTCSIIQNKAVSANGLSDGQATVTPLGGNGGYTYLWDNDETTAKAVALNAGLHTVTVTDSKGCKTTCEITITQPDVLSCSITQDAPAKCYGDSNGKATVTAIGGNGDYTYLWDNGETTAQAVGLNAGSHTVTVTDKLGYKTTCNITIGQPEAVLTCSIIQNKAVSANGLSDGQATVTPLGGNGGYTYLWDNDETTAKAVALNAGLHTVTVTDSKGCKTTCEITITQPDVLSCSITQDAPAKCYGDSNGKATVTAIGGNGDYTYLWDNGETTAQAVGLNAGSHTVTVTDKLGYKTTCNVTIGQPEAVLTCSIIQNKAVSANGLSDGQATVTPLGGNGGYTYLWDNDETTAKAVALNAGLHTVTVTDSKGCKTTCEITITQPDVLSCSITQDAPAKCYGDSNGKATVTAIGGNGDYTYLWDNGETTAQAVGLNAGSHTVTVTDKLGYKTTCNVTIGQPEAVLTCSIIQNKAVSANGLSDGQATVTPLGGNGGYTYLWDNDETTAKAVALNAGLHTVTVTDSKGCKTTCEITITQPDVLSCSITQDAPAKCYGDSNGKATVTAIGGNGDYTYLWDNGETTAQAVGLNAGSHTVTVTDKLGYKTTCNVTIGQPEAVLTCSIIQNKAVSANGLSDGQATVTPLGGNGGYTYLWDNDETTAKAVALNAGLHTVTVTDSKGCKTTCEITITQPDVLSCSITQDAPAKCYGDSNGKATVTAIGGNGDYTYLWDNGETTAQAVGLNAGSHTVTVTDKLGYKTTCNVTIGQPSAPLSATAVIVNNNNCVGCSNGSIDITVTGGTTPYTFLWSNGAITEDISNLPNGTYNVEITDKNGCKANYTYVISESSINITKDGTYVDSNQDGITNIGDEVTYNFVITNTGSVPLTNITVFDNNAVITGGPIDILAPGATDSTTFSGSHIITQDDINTGYVYNLATVTGKDPEDKTVTDTSSDPTPCTTCPINPECPDCTITPLEQTPGINITKDGTYVDSNQDGITNIGDVVTYNFVIKNTGNTTLTNITVTDNNATITGGPIASLAVGATDSTTFSGSHVITQDDINTGYVYNLATATGIDPKGNPVTDTSSDPTPCTTCPINPECPDCTITPLEQTPGINITKDGTYVDSNQDGITNISDVVTYNFVIKNIGNTTLTNITVTDNNATITGGPIASLAVGETDSTTFSGSHVITQEDINTGYVYNLATATGIDPKGNPVTDTSSDPTPCTTCPIDPECPDCTITPLEQTPGINITKDGTYVDSNQDGITNVGDVVTYNFVIKNTGNTTLTNITVTDNNATITGGPIASLAVGATDSTTFSGSHVITQEDINTGYVYNLATATGIDPKGNPVTDTSSDPTPCTTCPINPECTDCTITPLEQTPGINITKDGTYVDSNQDGITNIGDVVTYNFVIKNTGNTTLTNITVTDNNATITGGPIASLAVGATDSTTFSGSHVITQEDINTGYVYNLATATGIDPKGNPVTDTSSDPTPCTTCPINPECPDCTITPLTQSPGLVVIKTATTSSYSIVGDVINYTIIVKNTGNQTLHQITVKDPLTGLDTIIETLTPGANSEFTQSYTVTQEDLNKGSVTNVAKADGFTPNETPISASDDEIVNEKTNPIDAVDDNAGIIVGVNQITPNVINVFTNDTLNALPVNPADVILTTVTSNPFLQMNPDGSIDVLADAPVGTQTMTYQICEKLNTTNCDTAIVTVTIEAPSITVAGEGTCTNDVPYFSYTTTANNFTPVNGLTLTWTDSKNNVVATMTNLPLSGKVLWPGAVVDANGNGIDWPGWLLVDGKWIEGSDGFENLRPTASVTFTVNPSETITVNYPPSTPYCTARPVFTIDAVDDTAGPIDGINGATNVLNVFKNDTLNTVAVNPTDVTLTLVTADPTGYMTMNTDGSIDIKDGTPAGTYILTYQICENADEGNCDTATVTITVICTDKTKISGIVFNAGTNTPLANVPVNLVPQGTTTGPIQIKITDAQGYYNFTGMVPGDYLVQVQDANLNAAYQLYPINSSLFFTTLENCKYQTHDFGYDKSDLPVLGDFVWYDVNNNGIQDEWFDANNDGLVTKNIPDANGGFDYSKWEWIDLNGDGSYKGSNNVGELNAAGFGNAKSPNLFVTGPNDYNKSVIIGIQGFWRNRPPVGAFGDYKVELKMDANLEAQSSALGATGLVKVLPNTSKKENTKNTGKPTSFEVCGPTNGNPQTVAVTALDPVHLDIDYGISCKMFDDIQATNDVFNVTQCSILNELRNALTNDLINGSTANLSDFKFKLLTAIKQFITIDENGNIKLIDGIATGQYTFDYQVCEASNTANCSTATITINVGGIEPATISSTTCNADTTPLDLNTLLPADVARTGTWIDTDNIGGLNGSILNAFGLPINKYKYEYKLAGDCPRSIFLVLDVNDDCKVLACKSIIIHNAFSANEDGINDYFKIENLEDNLCYNNFRVEIYNRWGVLVFEKDNYNNEGNAFRGRSEGRTTINKNEGLPTGTYFYIISYDTFDGQGKTLKVKKDGYLYLVK
ncbi:DUF7507 domain-containing protein [Flavobacterium praedii]|uniref:DUF7507 domain-containing protein n=1 Tax=Flavobacterium praedii TaxID=3002900 RepID=UPI002481E5DD|nr:gliding motility-associated C-terminal domain-containing protein [Flavobacterium praedii]